MSEGNGVAEQVTPEVRKAYDALIERFGAFMQAFGHASELGIDAGQVIAQTLRTVLPPEEFENLPLSLRMLLG